MSAISKTILLLLLSTSLSSAQNFLFNGDFEMSNNNSFCPCPMDFFCFNNAGYANDTIGELYQFVTSRGCPNFGDQMRNKLGAFSGSGYAFFYAGLDHLVTEPEITFTETTDTEVCIYFAGPQEEGWPAQDTDSAFFTFYINGFRAGPKVKVPINTPWTQHCVTWTFTPGEHEIGVVSGGQRPYAIWFDFIIVCPLDARDNFEGVADFGLCPGRAVDIDVGIDDSYTYQWNDGDTSSVKTISQPGVYTIDVFNDCNYFKETFTVSARDIPEVDLGVDTFICDMETIELDAGTSQTGVKYEWSTISIFPTIEVDEAGTYWVEVSNFCGSAQDTIVVVQGEGQCSCFDFLPNAFSPNSDGLNDGFPPVVDCDLETYELSIVDRWGNEVFYSDEFGDQWTGSNLPPDVYSYSMKYVLQYRPGINFKKGVISLVR